MSGSLQPAVWFPCIRAGSGADVFTERLAEGLRRNGFRAEITWLPHRAEYAPWTVDVPARPEWANVAHINTWLPQRFVPADIPVVATIHHSTYDPAIKRYKGALQRIYHECWMSRSEAYNLGRSDAVVAVSRFAADIAKLRFGPRRIEVIHNGIDLAQVPGAAKTPRAVPFRLAYVGAWRVLKGVDLLPAIMERLGPAFELSCIGGMPAEKERGQYPANIRWFGRVDEPGKLFGLLSECDALLFPSRSEGLSLVLLESQACGLPVVAAANSSIPEVVLHEKTGLLCPSDDVEAFVRSIQRLAEDGALCRSLGDAARCHIARNFSEEMQITRYVQCYQKVVETG